MYGILFLVYMVQRMKLNKYLEGQFAPVKKILHHVGNDAL